VIFLPHQHSGPVLEPVSPNYVLYFATSLVCQSIINATVQLQFASPQDCSVACYQLSSQCDVHCQCAHLSVVGFSPEGCSVIDGSFLSSVTEFQFNGNIEAIYTFESPKDLGFSMANSCMEGFSSICASNSSLTLTSQSSTSSFLSEPESLSGLLSIQFSSA